MNHPYPNTRFFQEGDKNRLITWTREVLRQRGFQAPHRMKVCELAQAISHMNMKPPEAWEYLFNYRKKVLAQQRHPQQPPSKRDDFYRSDEWLKLRYEALKLHGGCCQACGARAGINGTILHVDHIKPVAKYPTLRLLISNVQVLCQDCNKAKGAWDETDWRLL